MNDDKESRALGLSEVLGAMNAAERLCRLLYGRGAEIGDTIGGLDAQMLHDAYAEIERLRNDWRMHVWEVVGERHSRCTICGGVEGP